MVGPPLEICHSLSSLIVDAYQLINAYQPPINTSTTIIAYKSKLPMIIVFTAGFPMVQGLGSLGALCLKDLQMKGGVVAKMFADAGSDSVQPTWRIIG